MPVEVTERKAGGLTAQAPAAVAVGLASGVVLARSLRRRGACFVVTSAHRVSFGIGTAAILDSGITLYGPGGTWMMNEHTYTTEAIHAIASNAAATIAVQEFIE